MRQVKFNVGLDTYQKFRAIRAGFTSNTATLVALVEFFYTRMREDEALLKAEEELLREKTQ